MVPDDENRGQMQPGSILKADGSVLIEDAADWEYNADSSTPRPELSYLCSQLGDGDHGWTQFATEDDVDELFEQPTYRINLRAATEAGE